MSTETEKQRWSVFGADYRLGNNPLRSIAWVWRDLKGHAWQTWMIFRAGFTAAFRQTVLGMVWGFVMPLVPLLAFIVLTLLRVFPSDDTIPPLPYMAVGVTLWLYLQGLMIAPTQAVTKHATVLKSSGFPMIGIFVASYGQLAFEMLIRVLVVVPILLTYYDLSGPGALLLPVLLLPATALCVSVGILLGLFSVVVPDLKNVAEIVLRYLIFISFVIFPLSLDGVTGLLYDLNPLAILIDNMRHVLITGVFASPVAMAVVSLFSVLMLAAVLHLYSVLERRVAGAL